MAITDPIEALSFTLQELAFVQPGYLNRERVLSSPTGTHLLLQARDISQEGDFCLEGAVRFKPERKADLYRIARGDILLLARGQAHKAYFIDREMPEVLASNVFYIIRMFRDDVLPPYLAWYLNQPDIQAELDTASTGTGIGYIARGAVERLPVLLPPLQMQHRIIGIDNLWRRKKQLQQHLDAKRELLIQTICRQAVDTGKE
jgi:hypothetical protein